MIGFVFGCIFGGAAAGYAWPRLWPKVKAWGQKHIPSIFGTAALLLLASALQGQQTRDSVFCQQCVVSSTRPDSILHVDTTITRSWIATVDTSWRDSLIKVPIIQPPPIDVASCPNEPATWAVVNRRNFVPLPVQKPLTYGIQKDAGWGSAGAFAMLADPTAPDGDGYVGQEFYAVNRPAGSATMDSWMLTRMVGHGYGKLYVCYRMWVDPRFSGNQSGTNKQVWLRTNGNPSHHGNRIFTNVYGVGTGKLTAKVDEQGIASPSYPTRWGGLAIQRGTWQTWEVLADGPGHTLTLWLDGAVSGRTSQIDFWFPGETREWADVEINNTYGGSGAPNPVAAVVKIDALIIRAAP